MPKNASLSVFADARYVLWVNGRYLDRGPSRFQPNGPQYDVIDITSYLHQGENTIALLVVGNLSGGKVMAHPPGLTVLLDADGKDVLCTDSSWKWSDKTRFRSVMASWANIGETVVDARVEDGDWTQSDYNDTSWKAAVKIDGKGWGPLTRTLIPPLRETPVSVSFANDVKLPVTLQGGEKLEFTTGGRMVQAYAVIEMDATAGTEVLLEPYGVNSRARAALRYLARAGKQSHFTIDSCGLNDGAIIVKSGTATITGFKLIERLYPYERLGSFHSNDEELNKLWDLCARSCELLSEDAYVDCADRERVEWMDNSPPGFDITRVSMSGPGRNKEPVYSDPRLLGAMVRRTGLTLQPEGWVKAHTCSDRYDTHAKMEDRACEWVTGMRMYYESSGDLGVVREVWPAVVAQMDYFLKARTPRGLVRARDWVVWGNPVGYRIGETTTFNVFAQKALTDASFLAGSIGDKENQARFSQASEELAQAINSVLWDEKSGAYFSGYFTDEDIAINLAAKRPVGGSRVNGLTRTTLHANLFALDRGVVPPDRRERVIGKLLEQIRKTEGDIMIFYYIMKQLYALDRDEDDLRVLSMMREGWREMFNSPLQCSWEGFKSGSSKAHIYGMYPGYFLSSYVLGVRWQDGVPLNRKLMIQPHLGDLTYAEGTVVTEAGPVFVSWKRQTEGKMAFQLKVPERVDASLSLPVSSSTKVTLNNRQVEGKVVGNRRQFALPTGTSTGASE